MNQELLKRLQVQAGGSHYPDINPDSQAKFAELIVRECAHVALMSNGNNLHVCELIKKHFGVEE